MAASLAAIFLVKIPAFVYFSLKLNMSYLRIVPLFCLLAACASEVPRTGVSFVPASGQESVETHTTGVSIDIDPGTGYTRVLPQGTIIKRVGSIGQGNVYRPTNFTLSVEGKHIHEAYLVLQNGKLVGFYLPVEKAFVASNKIVETKISN